MNDKISIVMPNFNGEALMEKNLPFVLKAMENSKNSIKEIIVVDDGSWDGSIILLKTKFPQVKVIKHTKNRGFSAAVNTGVRASKGELILLLNTDVVPESDFLVSVLPHFSREGVFAVSLHEKGYGFAKGGFSEGYVTLAGGGEVNESHPSFYVSGGSGVFSKKYWKMLGGMDEKLLSPFYWEDIDICYRAAKRGLALIWEPEAKVLHNHESTMSKLSKSYVQRVRERNQLLFIWKNIGSGSLIRKHVLGIIKRALKHPGYFRIVLMAMGRFRIAMEKRRKEIKESKVSDEAIFAKY